MIPCDSEAIMSRIEKYYDSKEEFKSSEYLRKLFNVVIWTPEFIGTDLEDFTKKTIGLLGSDSKLLQDEKLFLVINQILRSNPREIKQFLNNLVAALYVANNTEVRDIIFENIPYLAKVLIIRQKFPFAYKRLKDKWYEPEDIIEKKDDDDFRDFMVDTSIITTSNAEPFIYYKQPNQSKKISRADDLSGALVSGNHDLVKQIVEANKKKADDLARFVTSLYKKYKSNPDWLSKIIETFLVVSDEVSLNITKSSYYNLTADAIYRYVWQKYRDLPTSLVFEKLVRNTKTERRLRIDLVERYVAALSSGEIKEDLSKVSKIIQNLILSSRVVEDSQVQKIRQAIDENYSLEPKIVGLFTKTKSQTKYLSDKAFSAYVGGINYENYIEWLPTIRNYKLYIKQNTLGNLVAQKLNELLKQEREKIPAHNEKKKLLFDEITVLIYDPDSIFSSTDQTLLSNLGGEILTTYSNAGDYDNKYYMIFVLHKLAGLSDQNLMTQAVNNINQYIENASTNIIDENLIPNLENFGIAEEFVNKYAGAFVGRAVSKGGNEVQKAYSLMDETHQQQVINGLVEHQPDAGLTYIQSLQKLPNRIETIKKLLDKASKLQPQDRAGIYSWVKKELKPNDAVSAKDEAVFQIKHLLKQDQPIHQEAAFHFLEDASFLNETQKREIADEVIEWFKEPGKTLTQNHRFSVRSIALLFDVLSSTWKSDYVFELFRMLDRQNDRLVIEVAIESLQTIEPKFKDYEEYFVDIKEKLKGWGNLDNKNYVINELLKLQSSRSSKKEEEYWNELSNLS